MSQLKRVCSVLILSVVAAFACSSAALGDPYPEGVVNRYGHLHGGNQVSFWIHCHGHTHAHVHPYNHHDYVDLDLYVYDAFGNLRAVERSTQSSSAVHWDGDGDFRIVVHMYSGDHCDFHLTVD